MTIDADAPITANDDVNKNVPTNHTYAKNGITN